MAGDFNGTVNNRVDRKNKNKTNIQEGKLLKVFFDLVKQESMENIWRKFNPKSKDFLFK